MIKGRNRKRPHWEAESDFDVPQPSDAERGGISDALSCHAESDTTADILVEMKGDVEVWKRFQHRLRGLKNGVTGEIPERIYGIIESQLRATQENVEEVQQLVHKIRQRVSLRSDAGKPPLLGCPRSPANYAPTDDVGDEDDDGDLSRSIKRIRYSIPDDDSLASPHLSADNTPSFYSDDATSGSSSFFKASGIARVFGMVSNLLRRRGKPASHDHKTGASLLPAPELLLVDHNSPPKVEAAVETVDEIDDVKHDNDDDSHEDDDHDDDSHEGDDHDNDSHEDDDDSHEGDDDSHKGDDDSHEDDDGDYGTVEPVERFVYELSDEDEEEPQDEESRIDSNRDVHCSSNQLTMDNVLVVVDDDSSDCE